MASVKSVSSSRRCTRSVLSHCLPAFCRWLTRALCAHLPFDSQMITMGGNAELELVDSLDPFSEGIVFSVMPPKKVCGSQKRKKRD